MKWAPRASCANPSVKPASNESSSQLRAMRAERRRQMK
jgi:hypothetical protein